MHITHLLLFGTLLFNGTFQLPKNYVNPPPPGRPIAVNEVQLQNLVGLRRYQRYTALITEMGKAPSDPVLCFQAEESNAQNLSRSAELSLLAAAQERRLGRVIPEEIFRNMIYYKQLYDLLTRAYHLGSDTVKSGLEPAPQFRATIGSAWDTVRKLDSHFPEARSLKYIGSECRSAQSERLPG